MLPFDAPVASACPACHGSGDLGLLTCPACRGRKVFRRFERVRLEIPPGIADGSVFQVPVGSRWARVYLRIRVRVEDGG